MATVLEAPLRATPRIAADEPAEASDRRLLVGFLAGDQRSFTELVHRHSALVYAVCRRVLREASDADDAFQATFLVLARKARALRWQESIAGWLHQTARRTALNLSARIARRRRLEQRAAEQVADKPLDTQSPAAKASLRELAQTLDEELARLPAALREVLVLSQVEGLGRTEVADRLGLGAATVKDRLERARAKLRTRLIRRGITLSASAVAAWLAPTAANAAHLSSLAGSTAAAASSFASGTLAHGTLPSAAALAQGVLKMMGLEKLKCVSLCALTVLTTGAVAYGMLHDDPSRFDKGLRGQVVAVAHDPGQKPTITINVDGADTVLSLDVSPDAKVWAAYEGSQFADVHQDQYVSLRLADDHRTVSEIHVRGEQREVAIRNLNADGGLTAIDAGAEDPAAAEELYFQLAPDAIVRMGGLPATRDELKPGMKAPLELATNGKTVNAIEMDVDPSRIVEGEVTAVDAGTGLVIVKQNGENDQTFERSVSVPEGAIIIVDDKPGKLTAIKPAGQIRLRTADGQNAARAIHFTSPPPEEKPEEPAAEQPSDKPADQPAQKSADSPDDKPADPPAAEQPSTEQPAAEPPAGEQPAADSSTPEAKPAG